MNPTRKKRSVRLLLLVLLLSLVSELIIVVHRRSSLAVYRCCCSCMLHDLAIGSSSSASFLPALRACRSSSWEGVKGSRLWLEDSRKVPWRLRNSSKLVSKPSRSPQTTRSPTPRPDAQSPRASETRSCCPPCRVRRRHRRPDEGQRRWGAKTMVLSGCGFEMRWS